MTDTALYGVATLSMFFQSDEFISTTRLIESIFIILSVILVAVLVLVAIRAQIFTTLKTRASWYIPSTGEGHTRLWEKEWSAITEDFEQAQPNGYRGILLRANNVLGNVCEARGIPGDTLEEKLENMSIADLRNLDQVRIAYDAARIFIQDPEALLTYDDVWRILVTYENALVEFDEVGERKEVE